jgi:ABC-type multidrug transport system fused ATPase/permease subunit
MKARGHTQSGTVPVRTIIATIAVLAGVILLALGYFGNQLLLIYAGLAITPSRRNDIDLRGLFSRFRRGITLAVGLVVIEQVAWIVEPTVFGNVIDAFIEKGFAPRESAFLIPLLLWIAVFLVNSIVGAARRSVDQRIYLRMFTEIATDVARLGHERNQPVSRTAARAELSREYIAFFQYRLPEVLEQFIAIGGAITALYFFDWRIAVTCTVIAVPLGVMTRFSNRRILRYQSAIHDQQEQAYDVFARHDVEQVRSYYSKLVSPQMKIANWGALNFGIVRIALLAIFVVVLYIAIDLDDFSTGNIYSIVAYLWTFVTSSEYVPELMQSWTSLQDISRRVREDHA